MTAILTLVASTCVAALTASALLSACAIQSAPGEPTLQEVRQATERFKDVNVALSEGYIRDPHNVCLTAEMMGQPASLGDMGVHYFRPDLLGVTEPPSPRVKGNGTYTDFRKPAVLVYEPRADGALQLVAVENLVFADAWKAAGHKEPPTFHGVPYDLMVDDTSTTGDEAHGFEPHFDRHIWIYRENPNGVFSPLNPAVSCAHHAGSRSHPHAR